MIYNFWLFDRIQLGDSSACGACRVARVLSRVFCFTPSLCVFFTPNLCYWAHLSFSLCLSYLNQSLCIPVEDLASSVSVKALDGRPISSTPVTQITLPLQLTLKLLHFEMHDHSGFTLALFTQPHHRLAVSKHSIVVPQMFLKCSPGISFAGRSI